MSKGIYAEQKQHTVGQLHEPSTVDEIGDEHDPVLVHAYRTQPIAYISHRPGVY